jgi:hypothetical protein
MRFKRYTAAVAALCVLAAPAALAATVANTGGATAPQAEAEARAAAAARREHALRAIAAHRNVRLARLVAHQQGTRLAPAYARKARVKPLAVLDRSSVRLRGELRDLRRDRARHRAALASVPRSTLASIAQCESHGNPRAIGGGGRYRGMFQMTYQIWSAVGGSGDPAAASAGEQYYRAALLYRRYGSGQWPVCGR